MLPISSHSSRVLPLSVHGHYALNNSISQTSLTEAKFISNLSTQPAATTQVDRIVGRQDYAWIIFQFSALLLTCILATRQARNAYNSSKNAEARRLQTRQVSNTRPRFLIGLSTALWVRLAASTLSVFFYFVYPDQTKFSRVILFCLPSLFLLSGYSVATLFWLELNARVHFRDAAVYRPSVTLINAVFYLVFFAGFAVAHGHRASYELRIIAFILQGAAFIMTAAAWIICGRKVLIKFMAVSEISTPPISLFASGGSRSLGQKNFSSNDSYDLASPSSPERDKRGTRSVCIRMALLTVLCPMFFLAEGAACWYLAARMLAVRVPLQNFVSHFSFTAALLFACEWLPALIVVSVFRSQNTSMKRRPSLISGDPTFSDTMIDQPLLDDDTEA